MANHHMTDKGPIPFTAEEEIKWAEKEVIADKKRKEEMEEYERVKYQRDRKAEYDQMGNQFVAMGSWMANRMTHKIDTVDKKLDQLRLSSIERKEYKMDISQLHIRCNELEKSKASAVQAVEVKLKKEN